ncbi:hypothetical protein DM860_018190 [Cuscuta australis]|uniref:Autophagy-related protein n=1 Tax=Cuscuta australis TaxID=267555 RepID=A0A328D964_9ASTE|nr:hypothetical protein DM860_018190 [Cuscuta australis]
MIAKYPDRLPVRLPLPHSILLLDLCFGPPQLTYFITLCTFWKLETHLLILNKSLYPRAFSKLALDRIITHRAPLTHCLLSLVNEFLSRSAICRYLVPRDMPVGQFIHILGAWLHLPPGKALFIFVENTLPQTSALMESVYESFKDEDGFLYMCYSSEKTFGHESSRPC